MRRERAIHSIVQLSMWVFSWLTSNRERTVWVASSTSVSVWTARKVGGFWRTVLLEKKEESWAVGAGGKGEDVMCLYEFMVFGYFAFLSIILSTIGFFS